MARRFPTRFFASAPSSPSGQRGGPAKADVIPLDAFVADTYLPHARLRKRSWKMDERIARQHLSPTFGHRALADLTRQEVETWLQNLSVQGLAPATCNRILAVFKSVCSLAAAHGLLPAGQAHCSDVPHFPIHTLRERYLTPDEARRLMRKLEHSPRPEAAALRLLLLTGARKSEILKARWEYVWLDQRLLTVPLSKSGKPRHIPLSDEAVAVIRSIRRKPGCPWLFPGQSPGKPLSDIYVFWNKLRRELGLTDVRVHDLRHSFASFLVNAGHSLYEVQKLLGHSDPRTTMRYAHLGQASLVAAAETVSGFLVGDGRGENRESFRPAAVPKLQGNRPRQSARHGVRPGRKKGGKRKKRGKKLNNKPTSLSLDALPGLCSACIVPHDSP